MKQEQKFFELLNAPGQLATKINDIVVSSRDRLTQVIDALGNELGNLPKSSRDVVAKARGTLDEVRTDVLTLGKHNSDVGTGLKHLETWGNGTPDTSTPVPSGGGESWNQWVGDIPIESLSNEDVRYMMDTQSGGFDWKPHIGGNGDAIRNAINRAMGVLPGARFNQAAYIARNGPLVQRYNANK